MCLFYIIKFNCAIKIKTLNKFVRARICVFFFALGSAGAVKSIAIRKRMFRKLHLNLNSTKLNKHVLSLFYIYLSNCN